MLYDTVIHNGLIVTSSEILPTSTYIGIKDGKISKISNTPLDGDKVINCNGAHVTPGGIDPHVHLEEPKSIYSDTFQHATKIAIRGGTTTVISFSLQNDQDNEENSSIIQDTFEYLENARGNCYCDYGFHLIVRNPTTPLIKSLPKLVELGLTSCKVYTTYDSMKLTDHQILTIMLESRKLGITQMIHAENSDIIQFLNEKLESKNLLDPYYHAVSRPNEAEDEATYRVIQLSKIINIPLLIVHMSSKIALDHVQNAQNESLPIFAETCPQYLFLTNNLMKTCHNHSHHHQIKDSFQGAKYICSPPLRDTQQDLESVWKSLINGTITIFASDHAPSNYDDLKGKKLGLGDYKKIPNGLSGVETRLPLLWSHGVSNQRISPIKFVQLTSTNVAKLYGLDGIKGDVKVGYDADLVIWHNEDELNYELKNEDLGHEFDYTAFEGIKIKNWPKITIIRGEVVYKNDEILVEKGYGNFLKRGKSNMTGELRELNPILS
ncbi:Dihydropyrimidinase-related protein 1 [Wickerhamomyces ciferrii]|uniref:dihydropyrimidinase n=1 Tax=Wickerhamomyces ciferrii (strain ATCC 14091 / BCRC 22168 / CBS 111 / JCM 3599 / NBRC 0793 / NRRL Y-1031 F-60-10) TaxID=1206466 RepID=K0KXI9_WICCF|nr:Dihydropyrimidinase-related protein 1 [Wickerhamomyces ciferrii]CCH46199.1 Dihydropyrimidinase-related protein 1 [Wickerhamomyces ciferrii]